MVAEDRASSSARHGSRSKTLRAFRALRALRPKAALKMFQMRPMRTFNLRRGVDWMTAMAMSSGGSGRKRTVIKRLIAATFSTAAAFSLIPIGYALSAMWPEGSAKASPLAMRALGSAPANAISRWFGKFADSDRIPYFLHQRLIRMLIRTYGIDVSEIEHPIERYHSLQEFFSRRLVPGARPPHPKSALVSPCDAELLQVGRVTDADMIFQVKGDHYDIPTLMQTKQQFAPRRPGYDRIFFLFHLRPKDYHRFHCPADISVREVKHVPGTLHPVTYTSSKWIPGLFAKNERVSLMCDWQHGSLAFVPVGATCVGSISLAFDDRIKTNRVSSVQNFFSLFRYVSGVVSEMDHVDACTTAEHVDDPVSEVETNTRPASESVYSPLSGRHLEYPASSQPQIRKGDELGWFNWGSAIVIIADVPEGSGVHVHPLQDVRVGDPLLSW